jgi:hypothetical protein
MKTKTRDTSSLAARRRLAMTLIELMVAIGLAGLALTIIMTLYVFGLRCFASMGNYAQLNSQNRLALDEMTREIRQANQLLEIQGNGNSKWLILANTNGVSACTNRYSWKEASGVMIWDRWQNGVHTSKTNLTNCDDWTFEMYTRAPNTNGTFSATKDMSLCKLINMSWKCSRTILGRKLNSEAVLTAQIVLRNMQ